MIVDTPATWPRFTRARVARMATLGEADQPHLVPVTFAEQNGIVVTAVDHKRKSTVNLQRLKDVRRHPKVALLVDEYDEDWSKLWWIRVAGHARVLDADSDMAEPLSWLCDKYDHYRGRPPIGPVISIEIDSVASWAADDAS